MSQNLNLGIFDQIFCMDLSLALLIYIRGKTR